MLKFCLFTMIVFCQGLIIPALAQGSKKPLTLIPEAFPDSTNTLPLYWVTIGFGLVTVEGFPAMKFGAHYAKGSQIYSFRYNPHFTKSLKAEEIGALYGLRLYRESSFLSLSGGLGYVSGMEYSSSHTFTPIRTLGLALELQLISRAGFIGFGFGAQGNLNFSQSFGRFEFLFHFFISKIG